ncbi:SpoIIE family protein phosphatase [Jatrophihabitans endophyticus]|uniref:ATP-binding SpoIIE family protein phosphatase n=1 Tax=Jatrophihabitans endophyticus TaxID=1206085 RepID=UPI001A0C6A96|nr:SpoIIE family protein phosphatase [Jatrophihabitans endophyticus]MBE7188013.1 SpoIIE family protein phosphatase [Jatrophihabitans endophyticus]
MTDPHDRAAIFEVLPTPYVVLTPQLTIVDANSAYLEVTGRDLDELRGADFLAAFPPPAESIGPDGRSELQVSLERVRETGVLDTLPVQKYPIAGPDGVMTERHWLAVHVPVLDDDGRVRLIVQRTEDITEFSLERERLDRLMRSDEVDETWRGRAQRIEADLFVRARELADALAAKDLAAERAARLAEVALALSGASSFADVEGIVVGRGMSVFGADGGGIVSPDGRGGWRIKVNVALGEDVQTTYPSAPYDSNIPGCWSARTGQRLLLPTRESGLAFDADIMSGIYEATGRSAWAFLPLTVGEHRLGSLAASWVDEHHFGPDELDLLDGFAAQCAQALLRLQTDREVRQEAAEVRELAESLQQALLTPPPEPDHLHIVVRYRPAGHHAQVGGDWYDAFMQPSGDTMLVIGDVVGHDRVAAGKMGQLRGVLRTVAYDADLASEPDTPAAIMTRFEHAARGLAVDALATVVLARIERPQAEPGSPRIMRWTNAGHPPPALLRDDGRVEFLDSKPDLLVGVVPDTERHDHTVRIPDEATLVFYTDGLIERRGSSIDEGFERLRAVLGELADLDPEQLCDALLARLVPEAGDDDIALLAVRAHTELAPRPLSAGPVDVPDEIEQAGPADERVHDSVVRELPFSVDAAALARHVVVEHTAGLDTTVRENAELLVSELATNALRYGAPPVLLDVRIVGRGIAVTVTDSGPDRPVLADGRPDPTRPSGRGMLIVAALADDWGVTPRPNGGKGVWFELRP